MIGDAAMSAGDGAWRTLLLLDHTARIVTLTVATLGAASGFVGTFLVLRRRALLGDTLAHSMLPGVVLAFMLAVALGADGRSLPPLLLGAVVAALCGVALTVAIGRTTRLGDDAAMAIVLGGLFGLGVALLGVAQRHPGASAAGLSTLIYGKAASILARDAMTIAVAAICSSFVTLALFKELRLLCFDERFATSQGLPVLRLDLTLVLLVTLIAGAGLQAVGLILVVALLVIPPAAARLWTDRLGPMATIAACFGAASGWIGAQLSALVPDVPTGPVIVLVAAAILAASIVVGRRGGALPRWLRARRDADRRAASLLVPMPKGGANA